MSVAENASLMSGKTLAAEAASPAGARVVCGLAVLGGIALRFANLGRNSLWFDEGYTAWAVAHPVGEIVRIIRVDTAPPLYYLLLRGWTHLFGFSEMALRSMSALMSSIALLVFVGISKKLLQSAWAVALATCLFACSIMQVAYAHEARFYAMMSMMGAIDFYLVVLVCRRSSVWRLFLLAMACSISLWTNNMMAVYLVCLGLAWLILPGKRTFSGRLLDASIVAVVSAISFSPWVPTLLAQTRHIQGSFWIGTPDFALLVKTFGVIAGVHEQSLPHGDLQVIAGLGLVVWGAVLLAGMGRTQMRVAVAIAAFGVVPILLIYVYSHVKQSIFIERAFLPSGVVIPLLIVLPMQSARTNKKLSFAFAGLVLFLSVRSLPGHRLGEHPEDWRDAVAFAQSSHAVHRLVVCVSSDGEPLYRYYGCARDYGPRADVTAVPVSFFALDPPQTMQRVRTDNDLNGLRERLSAGGFDELVLIASHTYWGDHTERTRSFLTSHFKVIGERAFTGIEVLRFDP